MPLFDYRCRTCDHRFEELVYRTDEEVRCPECQSEAERLLSAFAAPVSSTSSAPACGAGGCAPGGG